MALIEIDTVYLLKMVNLSMAIYVSHNQMVIPISSHYSPLLTHC